MLRSLEIIDCGQRHRPARLGPRRIPVPPSPAGCIGECTAASAGFLIRPVDLQPAESGQILAEDTVDLDGRRGMAAQKSTGMRRLLAAVEADHAALRTRQEELEHFLLAAPPTGWGEAVAKARYLLSSSRMFSPTSSGCCRTETSARRGDAGLASASLREELRWQKVSNAEIAKPRRLFWRRPSRQPRRSL